DGGAADDLGRADVAQVEAADRITGGAAFERLRHLGGRLRCGASRGKSQKGHAGEYRESETHDDPPWHAANIGFPRRGLERGPGGAQNGRLVRFASSAHPAAW